MHPSVIHKAISASTNVTESRRSRRRIVPKPFHLSSSRTRNRPSQPQQQKSPTSHSVYVYGNAERFASSHAAAVSSPAFAPSFSSFRGNACPSPAFARRHAELVFSFDQPGPSPADYAGDNIITFGSSRKDSSAASAVRSTKTTFGSTERACSLAAADTAAHTPGPGQHHTERPLGVNARGGIISPCPRAAPAAVRTGSTGPGPGSHTLPSLFDPIGDPGVADVTRDYPNPYCSTSFNVHCKKSLQRRHRRLRPIDGSAAAPK